MVIFPCSLRKRHQPTDRWTEGWTDGWTDQRTDRPSYRDARTHLKIDVFLQKFQSFKISKLPEVSEGLKNGMFQNFWIRNDKILWKWAGGALTSHENGFLGFLTTPTFCLKGKDGKNFFWFFLISAWIMSLWVRSSLVWIVLTESCLNKAHKANDASSWLWNDCMMIWLHDIRLV